MKVTCGKNPQIMPKEMVEGYLERSKIIKEEIIIEDFANLGTFLKAQEYLDKYYKNEENVVVTNNKKVDYNPITSRFAWNSIRSIVDDNERKIVNEIATAIDQSVNANNVLTQHNLATQLEYVATKDGNAYFIGMQRYANGSGPMFVVFNITTKKFDIASGNEALSLIDEFKKAKAKKEKTKQPEVKVEENKQPQYFEVSNLNPVDRDFAIWAESMLKDKLDKKAETFVSKFQADLLNSNDRFLQFVVKTKDKASMALIIKKMEPTGIDFMYMTPAFDISQKNADMNTIAMNEKYFGVDTFGGLTSEESMGLQYVAKLVCQNKDLMSIVEAAELNGQFKPQFTNDLMTIAFVAVTKNNQSMSINIQKIDNNGTVIAYISVLTTDIHKDQCKCHKAA